MTKLYSTIFIGTFAAALAAVMYFNISTSEEYVKEIFIVEEENLPQEALVGDSLREIVYEEEVVTVVENREEQEQVEDVVESVTKTNVAEEPQPQQESVVEPEEETDDASEGEEFVEGTLPQTTTSWTPKSDGECAKFVAESPFFLDDDTVVLRREAMYRTEGDIETADLLREISCYPQAVWLTWKDANAMRDRTETVISRARTVGKTPVFVIYNSPDFHSTKWWVGNEGEDYLHWIEEVAKGIGEYPAWVIVEPDALGLSTDYSDEDKSYRLNELSNVVSLLKTHAPNSRIYLDAGHNKWKTPEAFADLLLRAGLEQADGFALNISNYQELSLEIKRGEAISALTAGKHFIIDTSRNGVGAPEDNEWCNASGRALGKTPTMNTENPLIDAFFWIKPPGESDGTCNGGPTPGQFWLEYAVDLVKRAYDIN